jgi:hypothetical protein
MRGMNKPLIQKIMSYLWFMGAFIWFFAAIGVAFFEYDPGVFARTIAFLLSAAYFYSLYEKSAGGSKRDNDRARGFK